MLPDGKTVLLTIPDLKPVMQMKIGFDLATADDEDLVDMDTRTSIYAQLEALQKK